MRQWSTHLRTDERLLMLRVVTVSLVAALCAGCSTIPARCGFADFGIGSSHMTSSIHVPFVLAELRGRFFPIFTDASSAWLDPADYRFQVNGPNGYSLLVPVAPDGTFHVRGLRPGRYCFHTASQYYQGYDGVIVIDSEAADATMVVKVDIGA